MLSTLAQHVVHAQLAQFDPEELARLGAQLDDDSSPDDSPGRGETEADGPLTATIVSAS